MLSHSISHFIKENLPKAFFGEPGNEREEKEVKIFSAHLIVIFASIQLFVALVTLVLVFLGDDKTLLVLIVELILSSVICTVIGSLLYKTYSRILVLFIFLIALLNLYDSITFDSFLLRSVLLPALVFLCVARVTYALFNLHRRWPDFDRKRARFPKSYYLLYVPLSLLVIAIAAAYFAQATNLI